MGAYEVGKLFFDMKHDRQLAEEFRTNLEDVMTRYGFAEEEKDAIRKKDAKFIYTLGVNPYLVLGWTGPLELDRSEFLLDLADAGPHPLERTTAYPGPSPAVHEMLKHSPPAGGWAKGLSGKREPQTNPAQP